MKTKRLVSVAALMLLLPAICTSICCAQSPGVTMENYNRLKTGMTYPQVVRILGKEGTELASNEIAGIKTVMYQWDGEGLVAGISGANMNAMFQNGKLIQKAQLGLR